jgi:hypothetical protein
MIARCGKEAGMSRKADNKKGRDVSRPFAG